MPTVNQALTHRSKRCRLFSFNGDRYLTSGRCCVLVLAKCPLRICSAGRYALTLGRASYVIAVVVTNGWFFCRMMAKGLAHRPRLRCCKRAQRRT